MELVSEPRLPQDEPGFPGIGTLLDKDTSPFNPHWFPLGSIVIYLLVAVRFLIDPFMDQVRLQDLASAGRALAAFTDTVSVLLLFFLGRRLFGHGAGLLAAVLGAFTVFNIQVTHFYRPESFVVLLALIAFWWMLNVLERGRLRDHAILGVVIGMTFAFRGSSLPILAPVALTYAALLWPRWEAGYRGSASCNRSGVLPCSPSVRRWLPSSCCSRMPCSTSGSTWQTSAGK